MDEFMNFDFQGLVKADRMHGRFKIKYKPDSMLSLICSLLLICRGVGDLRKPHYRSYVRDLVMNIE
jgi:hypothetical protein